MLTAFLDGTDDIISITIIIITYLCDYGLIIPGSCSQIYYVHPAIIVTLK